MLYFEIALDYSKSCMLHFSGWGRMWEGKIMTSKSWKIKTKERK